MSLDRRRQMIEPGHLRLSIVRQCELVSISRSGFYRQPGGETPLNLALMPVIDAQSLETPWYGSRQMARFGRAEIFNTDQGGPSTSPRFAGVLQRTGVRISMDCRGHWMATCSANACGAA